MQLLRGLHDWLLKLYPRTYRREYGEELLAVFNLSIDDATRVGKMETIRVFLQELISLPGAILFEHLRERRKTRMINRFGFYFEFSYGSWKEFLATLFPFFLVGGIWPMINMLVRLRLLPGAGPLGSGILLSLFGLFVILFVVGLMKGLPRWSLPYFGFALSLLSVYVLSGILGLFIVLPFRNLYARVEFLGDIVYSGIFWFGLLLGVILLALMTRLSPTLQPFQRDWTLGCFVVYGAVPFAVALTFDEYAYDEPFMLLIFLVLAVGAWLYLRASDKRKRFWTLFSALALSMFIAAAGKMILLPVQTWPFSISSSLVLSEVKGTIITWVWLALAMLVPLAIMFVPRSDDLSQIPFSEGS